MFSSNSEDSGDPAHGAEAHDVVKEETEDEREVQAEWRPLKAVKSEAVKDEIDEPKKPEDKPWIPLREAESLQKAQNFKEYMPGRRFNFIHMFCGAKDVLGEAISKMAGLQGINVRVVSFDKVMGMYLAAPRPSNDFLELARTGEIDGSHCGFPSEASAAHVTVKEVGRPLSGRFNGPTASPQTPWHNNQMRTWDRCW